MLRKLFVSILLMTTCIVANSLSLGDNGDGSWNVGYESSDAIGGFQFTVDGAGVISASGGDATSNGFMLSTSGTMVLGFSLSGSTISSGSGTLLNLTLDGTPSGLSGLVISDASGTPLDFTFNDGGGTDGGGDDGGGEIVDGCDLPDLYLFLSESGEVFYNSSVAVGGFQFDVDGATVSGASGGDAGAAGFAISPGGSTVLGFSFTGATFGPGCGTITNLVLNGDASGLSSLVFSDSSGLPISFQYYDGGTVDSCDDMMACNFGDEGDCSYPEENFDCDGNCTADIDCAGNCGGSAELDECGVCNGDGSSCTDNSVFLEFGTLGDGSIEVLNDKFSPVAGFQFSIDGLTITGANGGAATANGFSMSASGSTVIGFSLTGGTIPAGEAQVLCNVTFSESEGEFCLTDAVLSDTNGSSLDYTLGDCYSGPPSSQVQIIHNSASPTVDVYVDGGLAIEGFEYRTATPVLTLPTSFTVGIAAAGGE